MSRTARRMVTSGSRPYRPDFGEDYLQRAFEVAGAVPGVSASPGTDGGQGRAPGSDVVHHARHRIGKRFFVHPRDIPQLWQQLGEKFPEWHERQMEAVRTDVQEGLRIYAMCGPVLGEGFPWARLPEGPGGDGMYAKRPHRFAFAPRHGLACHHDGEAAARLSSVLRAWMNCAERADSPYCYDSNLGVIQRLLALSWCWVFVAGLAEQGDEVALELEWLILRIIHADIRFLEPRLGKSAPNNHLLADRFAAWYLRAVFPELLAAPGDGNEETAWRDELLRQTYADGGGFEHSTHYHEFACEMGAAYLLLCSRQQRTPDPRIEERVEALLRFQAALSGPECMPLPIGNAVEDALFPLDPGEGWCSGSLRELYRAMFRPGAAPAPVVSAGWVRAFWLLGGDLAPPPATSSPDSAIKAFPETGLYVLTDADRRARLTFRTAPRPGEAVVPGHMHADLLSVCLTINGQPFFVDPGTYTYRSGSRPSEAGRPPWRSWFCGPQAHNGLAIENEDPLGPLVGDFRRAGGDARAESWHRSSDDLSVVHARLTDAGAYEGTERTCIGVLGEYWLIIDRPPSGIAELGHAKYGFQLAPAIEIERHEGSVYLSGPSGGPGICLAYSAGLDSPECRKGCSEPLGGWVSPAYGALEAAYHLGFSLSRDGLPSAFLVGANRGMIPICGIADIDTQAGGMAVRIVGEDHEDIVICATACDGDQGALKYGGIQFEGVLCWTRLEGGRPRRMRWIHGHRFEWPDRGVQVSYAKPCDVNLTL